MTRSPAAKRNLHALWLCAAALLVAVVLTFLPALEFSTVVFTKRSGNTFVGDERYLEARAEAEAAAAAFEGAAIHETVIERVNSKGETTSMVTFDVKESTRMTIWQLLASIGGFSLSSVHTAHAFALCVLLAVVLGALSLRGQLACEHRHLPRSTRVLRTCAAWLGLAAMLCVPLFGMSCNYNFIRQVSLYLTEHAELSGQAVPALERLLYSAAPAGELEALLDGMTMTTLWPLWALLPVLFGLLLVVGAMSEVQTAFDMKRMEDGRWYFSLIAAVVLAVLGLVILANPFSTALVLMRFTGAALVVETGYSLDVKEVRKRAGNAFLLLPDCDGQNALPAFDDTGHGAMVVDYSLQYGGDVDAAVSEMKAWVNVL